MELTNAWLDGATFAGAKLVFDGTRRVTALYGLNGAGKTRGLAALLRATAGAASVDGDYASLHIALRSEGLGVPLDDASSGWLHKMLIRGVEGRLAANRARAAVLPRGGAKLIANGWGTYSMREWLHAASRDSLVTRELIEVLVWLEATKFAVGFSAATRLAEDDLVGAAALCEYATEVSLNAGIELGPNHLDAVVPADMDGMPRTRAMARAASEWVRDLVQYESPDLSLDWTAAMPAGQRAYMAMYSAHGLTTHPRARTYRSARCSTTTTPTSKRPARGCQFSRSRTRTWTA